MKDLSSIPLQVLNQEAGQHERAFATDVLLGLTSDLKRLSSRYIYDARGSELFSRIMDLEEYYPTRCEREILEHHQEAFAQAAGSEPFNLVELGAGDGRKTSILLEHFLQQGLEFRYVPIDISADALRQLLHNLRQRYPKLAVEGLVADYQEGLSWLKEQSTRRNFVLFMGSNIGNFNMAQALQFLQRLWHSLQHNDLLAIGFDLKKDPRIIQRAYDDAGGVTAEFNLNLLHRINRELGGNFNVDQFSFYSTYVPLSGAIESYLMSEKAQEVRIEELNLTVRFEEWEPIHTEYSVKYTLKEAELLAANAGFEVVQHLQDDKRWFTDSIWRVVKASK